MSVELMGVINITPDSFSDGGQFLSVDAALRHAEMLIKEGADILDIGAESSRPGAAAVTSDEEIARLTPFLSHYRRHFDVPLSLDTYKSEVAQLGIDHGVQWINDITGLTTDSQMIPTIAESDCGVIIMHMQGMPQTMQASPVYQDVAHEVLLFLNTQVDACHSSGIKSVMVDPGIGFGKTVSHNLTLLNQLAILKTLDCPIVIGTSRKSFIGQLTATEVDNRGAGTIASSLYAVSQGASVIRVHDVATMKQALQVWQSIDKESA